jgi:DNA-binding HxlR family transcriptional regulator
VRVFRNHEYLIRGPDTPATALRRCVRMLREEGLGHSRRFDELQRLMPDISHKVLTDTLRLLEREGLITRIVHSEMPSHVEYRLSAYGETVRPLIQAVRSWGRGHLTRTRSAN